MRVLFDQGTPVPLRDFLIGHEVVTAFELGWSEISNGDLLEKAEGEFDLLVTTDKQLQYQQNLANRRLAILVLPYASWIKLRTHAGKIANRGNGDVAGQLCRAATRPTVDRLHENAVMVSGKS